METGAVVDPKIKVQQRAVHQLHLSPVLRRRGGCVSGPRPEGVDDLAGRGAERPAAGNTENERLTEIDGAADGDDDGAARAPRGHRADRGVAANQPGVRQRRAGGRLSRGDSCRRRALQARGARGLVRGVVEPQPGVDAAVDDHGDEHQQHDQDRRDQDRLDGHRPALGAPPADAPAELCRGHGTGSAAGSSHGNRPAPVRSRAAVTYAKTAFGSSSATSTIRPIDAARSSASTALVRWTSSA